MYKFLNNNLIPTFFSISILILLSAYFIEHALGYEACNLCLISRIPYFFVITFSLFFFLFKKFEKIILILIFISFVSGALIAFYHSGIEQGFFDESLVCQLKTLSQDSSTSELLEQLENYKSKSCKSVDFKIFGFSLATINLFISLALSVIAFKNIFKNEKNK
jgi:disulfide bond formation protein DsbB|tara:strand:+ start:701 stop:1189 length:489 start_codon:yes stop_codon:yes gene_type:complete